MSRTAVKLATASVERARMQILEVPDNDDVLHRIDNTLQHLSLLDDTFLEIISEAVQWFIEDRLHTHDDDHELLLEWLESIPALEVAALFLTEKPGYADEVDVIEAVEYLKQELRRQL